MNVSKLDNEVPVTPSIRDGWETILVERRERVGLITLNRPEALNALNQKMAEEVLKALWCFDSDNSVGAIVITGASRAFAAGADITEMAQVTSADFFAGDFLAPWDQIRLITKPVIAAVNGYAFGGGCELAMLCDFIIASEQAQFAQPEIKLGILPGIGGTQRLTRAVGKALAMDLILTGRSISASEAKSVGLVARVVPAEELLNSALEAAHTIASYNGPAVKMAKDAVNGAFENSLAEGLRYERLLFRTTFATEGQKEGMQAFLAKRPAVYHHR